MILRLSRVVAAAAAAAALASLGLVVAEPAHAQQTYPPEVLSIGLVNCGQRAVNVTVDGVMPNSVIHIVIDFTNAPDVVADVVANALGFFNGSWPFPVSSGPTFSVTISGFDFPNGAPFAMPFIVDRRACPDLPDTGAESFPIGKLALGASLGGAFLIAVAIRRRPKASASVTVTA